MKSQVQWLVASLFLLFLVVTATQAQIGMPRPSAGSEAHTALGLSIIGKVQLEGGGDVMKDTIVVLQCGSQERASANVDSRGHFSLMLSGFREADPHVWDNSGVVNSSLVNCSVSAQAPGYRSSAMSLAGEQTRGIIQVGTLVLEPLSTDQKLRQNFTVSVASLAAPDKAKQQFEKGQEQEKKGKWAAASEYFRKAIQVYPRYALAWLELGRTQKQQNNFAEAQQSFREAALHDSSLLPAYFELARIEGDQKEWKALAETTAKMVQLAPDSSPMFWFLDAAANYNLHDLRRAENSAARGLRMDTGHNLPQLEYLYGLILGTNENYSAAITHIKSYLNLAPNAPDGKNAQNALSQFERLASKSPGSTQGR